MAHDRWLSIRKAAAVVALNAVLAIALFVFIEGAFSSVGATKRAFFSELVSERRHTRYDEQIGWVNIPNLAIDDIYGGETFLTNSQGFRNAQEFTADVPAGRIRLICSGDSYTMGFGVGNDDTWCQYLESIDERLETVNLGQGGYGVDQSYLLYKRHAPELEHDIHVFAFITQDFHRMEHDTYHGYGRPYFTMKDGKLSNQNPAISKRSYNHPRIPKALEELGELHSVRSLGKLFRRKRNEADKQAEREQTRAVVVTMFEELQAISRSNGSTPVFVYLPTKKDFMEERAKEWRAFMHREAEARGLAFVDLIPDFRRYPPEELETLFDDHYSEKGNGFIADLLYRKLMTIPAVASRLQEP